MSGGDYGDSVPLQDWLPVQQQQSAEQNHEGQKSRGFCQENNQEKGSSQIVSQSFTDQVPYLPRIVLSSYRSDLYRRGHKVNCPRLTDAQWITAERKSAVRRGTCDRSNSVLCHFSSKNMCICSFHKSLWCQVSPCRCITKCLKNTVSHISGKCLRLNQPQKYTTVVIF